MPHDVTTDARVYWGFRYSVLLLLGYAAIHLFLRIGLAPSIGVDDAAEQVFAQTLSAGYDIKQPPLYTWLIWLVQQVTGPVMLSFLILKYSLLLTLFIFYYRTAERLFTKTRFAAITAWSILLLYQIGWNSHEGVTQTQVLSVSCIGTLLAFLRIADRPSWGRYMVFGVAVAAGLLSKLGYVAFLACLAIAAFHRPPYRRILLSPKLVGSVFVVLLLTAPYLVWLFNHASALTSVFNDTLTTGAPTATATRIGEGLLSVALSSIGFLSPLLALLILIFPTAWLPRRQAAGPVSRDLEYLVRDMLLVGLAILVAGVVFTGVKSYKERWLHPFYLVAPLYFLARSGAVARPPPDFASSSVSFLRSALALPASVPRGSSSAHRSATTACPRFPIDRSPTLLPARVSAPVRS